MFQIWNKEILLKIGGPEDLIQIPSSIQGFCSLFAAVCAVPQDMPPQTTKRVMLEDVTSCSTFYAPPPDSSVMFAPSKAALTCEDNTTQLAYLPILVPRWRMPGPYATLVESVSCFLHMSGLLEVILTTLFPFLLA